MDDLGFNGRRSEVKGKPEEHGEEGDECGTLPRGRSGTVGARVDRVCLVVVVVVELGVRRGCHVKLELVAAKQ